MYRTWPALVAAAQAVEGDPEEQIDAIQSLLTNTDLAALAIEDPTLLGDPAYEIEDLPDTDTAWTALDVLSAVIRARLRRILTAAGRPGSDSDMEQIPGGLPVCDSPADELGKPGQLRRWVSTP